MARAAIERRRMHDRPRPRARVPTSRLAALRNAASSLYSMRRLPSTSAPPRSADTSSWVKIPA